MVLSQLDELFRKNIKCLLTKLEQTVFGTGKGSNESECVNLIQGTVVILNVLQLQNVAAQRSIDWIALMLHV